MHRLTREASIAAAWVAERIRDDFDGLAPQLFTSASPILRQYFERLSAQTPPLPLGAVVVAVRLLILERLVLVEADDECMEFGFLGRDPGASFAFEREYRVRIEPGRISTRNQGGDMWSTLHDEAPTD